MLPRAFDYALRALTRLARGPAGDLRLARQLADELGLPPAFLGKLLQPLVARGLLESQRGRSGGFRLARPAAEVRLIEVLEMFDERGYGLRCVLGGEDCSEADPCPMHHLWAPCAGAVREALESWTIADLVRWSAEHPDASWPVRHALASPPPEPDLSSDAGRARARAPA